MKSTRKIIVGLLLAAGVATAGTFAYAHPDGYGPGMGGPGMMDGNHPGAMGPGMFGGRGFRHGMKAGAWGDPAVHFDAHLAAIKVELKITADQESAWQAYAAQAKKQAETMQALHTQIAGAAAPESAPERLSQRAAFMKQRTAHLEAMSAALKSLYTVLTPEQKAIADHFFGGVRLAQSKQFGPGRGR
jgi:protein CpxP